ncbi:MAG: glutamate racemase [Marinisporobacter sp.]|jgi:glutamate racemase|nr:glutamate racemase [Marinisporobacter sp.]
MNNKPIGVFDSGVGGLTVVLEILRQLPNEEVIYFGDTARNPYGPKPVDVVTDFSEQITRFLLTKDVKAVIIACNTATIASLDTLSKKFDVPIIGVVDSGVESAVMSTQNKKIGLIATENTVKSHSYKNLIVKKDPKAKVFSQACPLLVSLAEECLFDGEISYLTCKYYLEDLIKQDIDCLILGCTHFPLHKSNIKKELGTNINLVDPALGTVEKLKNLLKEKNMLKNTFQKPDHKFYISGNTEKFTKICNTALNGSFIIEQVEIEKY